MEGDRCIEWGWTIENLPSPPARVLDIGCTYSITVGVAAFKGLDVTGVDLNELGYGVANLTFIQKDATTVEFREGSFDCIVLCSTLEHVGLGGRYGSGRLADGDLLLMEKVRQWLAPQGKVILTIPVGKDQLFDPMHRVYGVERLSLVLRGFTILKEEYWEKVSGCWRKAAR